MSNKYCVYISGLTDNKRGDFYDKESAVKYAQALLDEYPANPNLDIVISRKLPVETNSNAVDDDKKLEVFADFISKVIAADIILNQEE